MFTLASGLLLVPSLYRAFQREAEQIFADHLLVLSLAYIGYFVIGALLIPFGPRDQADYALSSYWVSARLGLRITAVNCIGFGLALLSGSLVGRTWVSRWAGKAIGFGKAISQGWAIVAFLLIGGASSLYVLPYDVGLKPGLVSGTLRTMSMMVYIAILVAAAHRGRGSSLLLGSAIALTLTQAFAGLLMLNKSSILLPIVALLAGLAWRYGVRRVALPGLAVLLAVFLLVGSLVHTGRNTYGIGNRVDWQERTQMMFKGLLASSNSSQEEEYHSWARFCYISSQGAALDLYDSHQGSKDYTRLGWALLPRLIFPDKPMITTGREFNIKITGSDYSSNAPGIFLDGYYNLGWWGVIIVGVSAGCILAWTSAFAREVFRARALIWVPVAMLGGFMAFRVDGNFLADFWGTFVLFGYLLLAAGLLTGNLKKSRKSP
jgi:hypothetical protein